MSSRIALSLLAFVFCATAVSSQLPRNPRPRITPRGSASGPKTVCRATLGSEYSEAKLDSILNSEEAVSDQIIRTYNRDNAAVVTLTWTKNADTGFVAYGVQVNIKGIPNDRKSELVRVLTQQMRSETGNRQIQIRDAAQRDGMLPGFNSYPSVYAIYSGYRSPMTQAQAKIYFEQANETLKAVLDNVTIADAADSSSSGATARTASGPLPRF